MLFCSFSNLRCRVTKALPSKVRIMRRHPSQRPDSDVEIVEDSEPERIQLRNQKSTSTYSNSSRQRKNLDSGMHQSTASLHTTSHVIEISDSDSDLPSSENAIIHGLPSKSVKDGPSKATLDLQTFAFKAIPPKSQAHSINALVPRQPKEPRLIERQKVPKTARTTWDIRPSEVAQIYRCICCSVSWTARKSTAQKLEHIQRCAKKHSYDEETVRILMKSDVAASKVVCRKSPATDLKSATLLEDVVQPRSNKRQTSQSVNPLSMSTPLRQAILSRAKDVITRPSPDELPSQPSAGGSIATDFLLTQVFRSSSLTQGSAKTSLFSATGQDERYLPEVHDAQFGVISMESTPIQQRSPISIEADFEQSENYKGEEGLNQLLMTPQIQKTKKQTLQVNKTSSKLGTEVPSSPKPSASKVKSSKTKVAFGKEWETFMTENIRKDKELNLRVVRYEPVELALFLKIARLHAPHISEGILKKQLCKFLDDEAIHFYEGNVWNR